MKESAILLLPIFLPIVMGLAVLVLPVFRNRRLTVGFTAAGLFLTAVSVFAVIFGQADTCTLFALTETLPVFFHIDAVGRLFAGIGTVIWCCCGVFAFSYMEHEREEKRYYGFYLIVYGVLTALDFTGNLITFYMFYEMITLLTMPLVLHTRTREAVMAGLKYLFYSFCGAYMVLYGIYILHGCTDTLAFTEGGIVNSVTVQGREPFLLFVAFLMIMGFGVKAGLFPFHGWLPAAHPVAPAPASAVLSGMIVKCGVLGLIRTVYYVFGAAFIRHTWVQTAWIILALFTVFMGSMLACREKVLKRRLAYSTVSQVSYIQFGLALLHPVGFTGALLHTVFHAVMKSGLFLCAGAVIRKTEKTNTDELRGIGREMPVTIWCYTFFSLSMIGIPPACGYVSKLYLATGAMQMQGGASGLSAVVFWLGPVVLLVSALLTAYYLLPVTIHGFFPGEGFTGRQQGNIKADAVMLAPLIILAVLAIGMGMFPAGLTDYITSIASVVARAFVR